MNAKISFKVIAVLALILSIFTISGCKNKSMIIDPDLSKIDQSIVDDSKGYYGKVITKNDFPVDKLLPESYGDALNNSGITVDQVGGSPEMAMVSLIFDENNILYTAKRFNSEAEKNNHNVGKYRLTTDINTFYRVTKLPEATREYSNVMPGANGQAIWIFDSYVKFFTKRSELELKAMQKLKSNFANSKISAIAIPAWAQLGNIIMARWDGGGISDTYGHTGGIVVSPQVSANTVGAYMQSTKTIEASNLGKSLASVTIGTSNGVFSRWMSSNGSNYWASSLVYARYAMWRSGMTSAQRSAIVAFMNNQIGETYLFNISKNNDNYWYCSKLQYRAYLSVLGIDIDSNGGDYVLPMDIVNSNQLVGMSFWQIS